MANTKKFLDYEGVQYLWSKVDMNDYPNNTTLMNVINAIDETKADVKHTHTLSDISNYRNELNTTYATKSYVDNQITSIANGNGSIPDYVISASEKVAEKIISTRNSQSLVLGAMSDLHTNSYGQSAESVNNACLALNEINKLTQLDLIAHLGDTMVDNLNDANDEGFKHVRKCLDSVSKSVPTLWLQGNHDDQSELNTEEARQKCFAYIGANNVNTVTDFNNRFRNYGYKDFDDLRFRVIYLNTTDTTEAEQTGHIRISPTQLQWLSSEAINFSNKIQPETWHFVVLSHVPLNAQYESILALQTILKAMVDKQTGSVSVENISINYDFSSLKQKLVCHIHGHIHNFRTEWFDNLLSLTVPNACFDRNNEYGMTNENATIREIFGDKDKQGNQRQFNKTTSSEEDTSFNVIVIDSRVNNKVYAYNYGAGINRIINLSTKTITEINNSSMEGDQPLPDGIYVNALATATEPGSTEIYNGKGYKENCYLSSSNVGGVSSVDGHFTSGVIAWTVNYTNIPEIYILGTTVDFSDNHTRMAVYNDSGAKTIISNASDIALYFDVIKLDENYYKMKPKYRGTDKTSGVGVSYMCHNQGNLIGFRISLPGTGDDVIISIRNPIVDGVEENIWADFTNLVLTSKDLEGNAFNSGLGYKQEYRLNSSGNESSQMGSIVSGYINYNKEVIRAYGSTNPQKATTGYYIDFYDGNHTFLYAVPGERAGTYAGISFYNIDNKYVFAIDSSLVTDSGLLSAITNAKYIRVSVPNCSELDFTVTLNEDLTIA